MNELKRIAGRIRDEFNALRATFGQANGVATLNASGKLPDSQLSLSGKTTDALAEGSTNRYFTDARAQNALASSLAAKQDIAEKGAADGYASLDSSGTVPLAQLPAEATNSRVGEIGVFPTSAPPPGVVYFNRAELDRNLYPELWSWVQNNPEVYDDTGAEVQKFGPGDGSTTFELPDWQGLHLRMAGLSSAFQKANGTYYDGGSVFTVMLDALMSHTHIDSGHDHSIYMVAPYYNIRNMGQAGSATEPNALSTRTTTLGYANLGDATAYSYGYPRIAPENRVGTISINAGIYYA